MMILQKLLWNVSPLHKLYTGIYQSGLPVRACDFLIGCRTANISRIKLKQFLYLEKYSNAQLIAGYQIALVCSEAREMLLETICPQKCLSHRSRSPLPLLHSWSKHYWSLKWLILKTWRLCLFFKHCPSMCQTLELISLFCSCLLNCWSSWVRRCALWNPPVILKWRLTGSECFWNDPGSFLHRYFCDAIFCVYIRETIYLPMAHKG